MLRPPDGLASPAGIGKLSDPGNAGSVRPGGKPKATIECEGNIDVRSSKHQAVGSRIGGRRTGVDASRLSGFRQTPRCVFGAGCRVRPEGGTARSARSGRSQARNPSGFFGTRPGGSAKTAMAAALPPSSCQEWSCTNTRRAAPISFPCMWLARRMRSPSARTGSLS